MNSHQQYPPYTVGVDLGGTNTVVGIVDSVGHILASDSFPTRTPSVADWADRLTVSIQELIKKSGTEGCISGIGIGAPCANAVTGCIEAATDLPWPSPIPLAKMISERTNLKTVVTNDANAAAMGEMAYGSAVGLQNFIVLTLGTGVGSGIVCDGHLLSGRSGFAGELGHVTFPFAADRDCGCGRKGCLQTVASAKGVVATARKLLAETSTPSMLRDIADTELTAKKISEAATAGDTLAKEVYRFTGECLGKAAAEFAAMSDPEAIILFGGVSKAGNLILEPMRKAFHESALHLYRDRVRFLLSSLPDADAAVLGAASLPKEVKGK